MNEQRILIDDALMLLRSKMGRAEILLVQMEKALAGKEISMERIDSIYNEFYSAVEEVEEFLSMLYDITARVLGYEVEESDE